MCGICGLVDFNRPVASPAVERMNAAIIHRGPDDDGVYCNGVAALAMRRLAIIDLAGGHQPMSNEDDSVWIVFNGEIYNYQALRDELQSRGHRFKTDSDTETMLHLYEDYGPQFVQRLNGMFAVAIWDDRRRQLVLVRDRMGVKPLYYALQGGRLRFASETKAILQDDELRRTIDRRAVVEFLNFNSLPGPATMFQEIRRLPPGHFAVFDRSGLRIERYWDVDYSRQRDWKMPELLEAVDSLLSDSVRLRMISDVPLGAFLSGGIDSSLVVALMARFSDHPVEAFSIGFGAEGAYMNELEFSQAVARHCGARHHRLVLNPDDLLKDVERVAWYLDEPCGDPAAFLTLALSEFTRQHVIVALSGIGGDELFGGYRRYLALKWQRWYLRLPAWVRQGLVRPLLDRLPEDRSTRLANLSRIARKFVRDVDADEKTSWARSVSYLPDYQESMFVGELASIDRHTFTSDVFNEYWGRVCDLPAVVDRALYLDAKMYLADQLLFLQDKMSMVASLEAREPLLDHRLVELAATVPASTKIPGGELKAVLKRLAERYIPRHCVYREKKGFVAPVGAWFRGPLREQLEDALSPAAVRGRGIFEPAYISWMKRAFFEQGRDLTLQLYQAFMLELWFRLYVDGGGRRFLGAISRVVTPASYAAARQRAASRS